MITYDERGGFYDHVPPPPGVPPGDRSNPRNNGHGFQFDQLGVRVPTVVVSPWVPDLRTAGGSCNVVDNTVYDHSSLLATVERLIAVPPLAARDAAANDFLHLLSAEEPREAPLTLPAPADSGFRCESDHQELVRTEEEVADDLPEVAAAVRAFVHLAAILDTRLRPEHRLRIGDRARGHDQGPGPASTWSRWPRGFGPAGLGGDAA